MNAQHKDIIRQWLNLLAAPMMWILSTLPQVTNWGRSAKEFSDINDSLLVPYGVAFSIWLPIFVGCIGYAILQGVKANRSRAIFRKTGWWTAGGFISVCLWALISGWGSPSVMLWGTALAFLPTVYCFVKAMLILTRNKTALDRTERLWVWAPISLIAGWTSLAIFLNWTPIFLGSFGTSVPDIVPNIIMLGAALIWAVFIVRKSSGNPVYVFPIIWGLAWLAFKALAAGQTPEIIGGAALLGLVIIATATVMNARKVTSSGIMA
jgi:hypothetical protein